MTLRKLLQAVTLLIALFAASTLNMPLTAAVVCFLLFRIFDIFKPWPVCALERLKGGLGVLADDLFAGLYAGACYLIFYKLGWIEQLNSFLFGLKGLSTGYAIILGTVQGLTEFLPVSSSGHLVLFESFMHGLDPDTPEMLLFDLSIHVGTVIAIVGIYIKDIPAFSRTLIDVKKYSYNPLTIFKRNPAWRILVCAGITTVVTVVLYKIFEDPLKSARQLSVVAFMWLITGTLLLVTDGKKRTKLGLRDFGILGAIIIGAAQAGAIMPGISRSGATICAAILWGLHRRWAVEYSFLIALPAIIGGTVLELIDNPGIVGSASLPVTSIIAGMISSCLVGMGALRLLIYVSQKRKLKIFAVYCYTLAAISIIYIIIT
jgi:undecaprenyl-diphosphatase